MAVSANFGGFCLAPGCRAYGLICSCEYANCLGLGLTQCNADKGYLRDFYQASTMRVSESKATVEAVEALDMKPSHLYNQSKSR